MSVNARTNVRTSVWEPMLPYALPALLAVGFLLRLLFINASGFDVDVRTFEAWTISLIELTVGAEVPGIDEATFAKIAEGTKQNCPVSRALAAVKITLDATLKA